MSGESLVARRVQHARATFEATVEFAPEHFQQMAGITAYYNSRNWYFLRVGFDEVTGAFVDVLGSDRGRVSVHGPAVPVHGPVRLRLDLDGGALRASYGDAEWGPFDASILSDEYARDPDGGFTGAFFGLWALDMTGAGRPADFSAATYKPQR